MNVKLMWLGKSKNKDFNAIINEYKKRLKHYTSIDIVELKETANKSKSKDQITKVESKTILNKLESKDFVVLLDERGKHLTSVQFSNWIQHKLNISIHSIVFIIAGAYGAHADLKNRADYTLSLSHMTLTHDMVRMVLIEQLYRGFTILKGEKYHNE